MLFKLIAGRIILLLINCAALGRRGSCSARGLFLVLSSTRPKLQLGQMWNHAAYELKLQSFVACAVEMNLTWNLTETERLTLHYDSVEELGRLACFQCLFFATSRSHYRIEFVAFALLTRGNLRK